MSYGERCREAQLGSLGHVYVEVGRVPGGGGRRPPGLQRAESASRRGSTTRSFAAFLCALGRELGDIERTANALTALIACYPHIVLP
jgi:hypothetical protein